MVNVGNGIDSVAIEVYDSLMLMVDCTMVLERQCGRTTCERMILRQFVHS